MSPDDQRDSQTVDRYESRRLLGWEQRDDAVMLRVEGVRAAGAGEPADRPPETSGRPGTGAPTTDTLTLVITVLESGAVRLVLGAAAEPPPNDAEDEARPAAPLVVTATADAVHLTSARHGGYGPDPEDVTLQIGTEPLSLAVVDAAGRSVVRLAAPASSDGPLAVSPLAWVRSPGGIDGLAISFALEPDERLSGLGERAGPLDLVGSIQRISRASASTAEPAAPSEQDTRPAGSFLLSSRGYGLFVNASGRLVAELGTRAPSSYTLTVEASSAELFLFPATWPRTAVAGYARLTGRAPLPAERAFRLIVVGDGTVVSPETVASLARLRAAGVACEDPGREPYGPSLLERQLAALVETPTQVFTGVSAPAGPPADEAAMRGLLQHGLSFGLVTPGYWQTSLTPSHAQPPLGPGPFVRWAQLALLGPLVRTDPTVLDRIVSPGRSPGEIVAAYTRLRYRLLPYLLHCARETADAGLPMLRPLFLEFSWDAQTWSIDDQYLLGRDLLVAPVFSASAEPVRRRVYLPAYAHWYDWWTGTLHQGGQWLETSAPLERMPLYARAGTTIPLADPRSAIGMGPVDVSRLVLFAPVDGAIGASVELGDGDMLGVEQARGPERAKIYVEGLPASVRDLAIVGLPAGARLVDAASPAIRVVERDDSLPGLGGAWSSLTVGLEVGAYTTGLELAW